MSMLRQEHGRCIWLCGLEGTHFRLFEGNHKKARVLKGPPISTMSTSLVAVWYIRTPVPLIPRALALGKSHKRPSHQFAWNPFEVRAPLKGKIGFQDRQLVEVPELRDVGWPTCEPQAVGPNPKTAPLNQTQSRAYLLFCCFLLSARGTSRSHLRAFCSGPVLLLASNRSHPAPGVVEAVPSLCCDLADLRVPRPRAAGEERG